MISIKVKKLTNDAILPAYQTQGAACFDLHTIEDGEVSQDKPITLRTGLSFEIPENHVMLVFSRSGHGFKNDIRLANCVGVIDSDYRGEVVVKLTKDGSDVTYFESYSRVAQAMIIECPKVSLELVEDLSDTERGQKGFGSTGT